MNKTKINGNILRAMILTGARKLEMEKSNVDSLNVFPVPDGDTGTNMSLTLSSAAKAVQDLPQEANLMEVTKSMAYGALMGARGNSGVILSQFLDGFAKGCKEYEYLDVPLLAKAFKKGVETAYKAVVKPIEGTILTVMREAADKLNSYVENNDLTIDEAFKIFIEKGNETLLKTPEMLPVLKQAGVVDAGGKGFLIFIEGMFAGFKGEVIDEVNITKGEEKSDATFLIKDFQIKDEDIEFQYCTELIIKKFNKIAITSNEIKEFLEEKGDCVLVVGSDDIIKIHVHTNHPGQVLEFCINIGSLHDIKIENMLEQSQERQLNLPKKKLGVISVSYGEGLNEIFRSLGVDYIISGGQTMNPSTEDFIKAINEVNAKEIILLPNNKNIILAAQQAVSISEKPAKVVISKTIPQGIAALMAFNGELDLNTNIEKMQDAVNSIKTGEITYAIRDAQHNDIYIKEGQIIGIIEGNITVISDDINKTVLETVEQLTNFEGELVTLYYGKDIKVEDAEKIVDQLSSSYPNIDFELHYGGQPLYYYLISIE